eukprot:1749089-Lingulodinium_polyedra.AAC.1
MKVYKINPAPVTFPWFQDSGDRTFRRHSVNMRYQAVVLEKYQQQILDNGVVQGVRGEPWIIDTTAGPKEPPFSG